MSITLNHTTDPQIMRELADKILARVFETLKPPVSQYPNGIQIGQIFLTPEESGRRFDIAFEGVDAEGNLSGTLDYVESAFSLHETITRALMRQLEPQIEQIAFDVILKASRSAGA